MYVIGIDAGGTKTVCQLADDRRPRDRRSATWRREPAGMGELEVEKVLYEVMQEALGESAIVPAAICLGIAGVDRPEDGRVVARNHAPDRVQGADARRQRRAGRARGGRAR